MELVHQLTQQLGIKPEQASGGLGGAPGAGGGMLGGQAGGTVGKLGNLASLAGGFKQLGLDAGMISKFVPIVLNFFQSKGGDAAKGLLAGTLK